MSSALSLERCPECAQPWNAAGTCPVCALERAEAERFLAAAFRRARRAHDSLRRGDTREAAEQLQAALALGVPPESVLRLAGIIRALNGEWDAGSVGDAPEGWRTALGPESGAADYYRQSRAASLTGDWPAAREAAEACLEIAPWFLPARKLRVLTLMADGRYGEAQESCEELLAELPGDPDLLRYYRYCREISPSVPPSPNPSDAPSLAVTDTAGVTEAASGDVIEDKTSLRPEAAPTRKGVPLSTWGLVLGVGMAAYAVGRTQVSPETNPSVTPSVAARVTPTEPTPTAAPIADSSPSSAPARPTPEPSPSPLPAAKSLPPNLAREEQGFLAERNLQLARRWFNKAVSAQARGEARKAGALAEASLRYAGGTYLEEEALLLQAQAAEKAGDPNAARYYRGLAERFPKSVYAGVARRAAERLSRKAGMP